MAIEDLCSEVESVAGWKMKTTGDFDRLTELIQSRIHERISPTTLKRLWGYLDENVKPRKLTLDLLSKFLGYTDYNQFCEQKGLPQSDFLLSKKMTDDDLTVNEKVQLNWAPDRECLIRYLGDGRFIIEKAVNTKLHVGDTFTCHLFLQQEPLYLSELIHDGQQPISYVAGKKSGVVWNIL